MGSIKNIQLYVNFVFLGLKLPSSSVLISSSFFCIIALGSGQRLLYRLGLVLVLVLPYSVEVNIRVVLRTYTSIFFAISILYFPF